MNKEKLYVGIVVLTLFIAGCAGFQDVTGDESGPGWSERVSSWGDSYKAAIAQYEKAQTEGDLLRALEAMKNVMMTAPNQRAHDKSERDLCLIAAGLGDLALYEFNCLDHDPIRGLIGKGGGGP